MIKESKYSSENIAGIHFCTLDLPNTIELLAEWSGEPGAGGVEQGAGSGEQEARGMEPGARSDFTTQPPNHSTTQPTPARWFACVNPHSVEEARRHAAFREAVAGADLATADGTGIVVGSILLGGQVRDRVCGPDIFPQLCDYLNARKAGTRMFFLGTNDETLAALEKKFGEVYPHLEFAGGFAPPYRKQFSEDEHLEMVERVNASNADVLWVGLGAPKQELWCHHNAHRLNVRLIGPVGGVFDFFTGRVKLPPSWAQEMGMIWLWRLIQQPRRLLRRNLDAPVFLWHVLKQRLGR